MLARYVLLWMVLTLGSYACAPHGARPKCPAEGGHPWREVTSPNFRVVTDLSFADARVTARGLESSLDALRQGAFEHSRTHIEPTTVVVFESESDLHAFVPQQVAGRFMGQLPGDLEPTRIVLLSGEPGDEARINLMHELTHDLFDLNFGPAPVWLSEGWAQYYSTIQFDGNEIVVGLPLPGISFTAKGSDFWLRAPDHRLVRVMDVDSVTLPSRLLAMSRADFYRPSLAANPTEQDKRLTQANYIGAWALVHMFNDWPARYVKLYQEFLRQSLHAPADEAFRAAFASVSLAELDHDFRLYLVERQMASFRRPGRPSSEPPMSNRLLTDSEVHLLWARLSPAQGPGAVATRHDLDQAIAAEPAAAEPRYFSGIFWLHAGKLTQAEQDLDAAIRKSPADPRFLYAQVVLHGMQRGPMKSLSNDDPLLQTVEELARVAQTPTQLTAVAAMLGISQDAERGLTSAKQAVKLAPIDFRALDITAFLLAKLGRLDEALRVQRAAAAFVPESTNAPEIFDHLRSYESRAVSGHE
jgi:tetratricopeptide (TPR) repeat protein